MFHCIHINFTWAGESVFASLCSQSNAFSYIVISPMIECELTSLFALLQGTVCCHTCAPTALVWTSSTIVAAGCDRRVLVYALDGEYGIL